MNEKDVSYKSMSMIQDNFARLRHNDVWIPDLGGSFTNLESSELDVLLMGSYFERIFQPEFWPSKKFNLFCLSPQVRNILIDVYKFDPHVVGCLSRYDYFPKTKATEEFSLTKETHFYYAGRISPQKNIEFLLFTIFHLQMLYSPKITLSLFGSFDSEYHKDILGCPFMDYSKKIKGLIEGLPWAGAVPEIHTGLNEYEWPEKIPARGIFITTSNLISEDFSVTAAQLQYLGRALLLPKWGGFYDVRGENVRHFSVEAIAHSHLGIKEISAKAKEFVLSLIEEKLENLATEKTEKSLFPDTPIDRNYLEFIRQKNIDHWGECINLLVANNLPAFVATEQGRAILEECRRLMRK